MATTDARNRVAFENDGSRVDGRAKVTGAAKYTYDINLPNMVYAEFVRSPFANATLKKFDIEAARKIKGVLVVEMDAEGRGEYGGQSVGHVCAESPQLIRDAIEALAMEWEHGAPASDLRAVVGELAPMGADAVPAGAAHVIEATYETQVQHHVSLESHGAVAQILPDGKAKVWGSTQGTSSFRDGLEKLLEVDKKDIEIHCEYVGGGFGSKFGPGIEGQLAARLAKQLGRPCKVMNNRKDESRDTGMRPGTLQRFKLAADEKGKIVGGAIQSWSSIGTRGGGGAIKYCDYDLGTLDAKRVKVEEVKLSSCAARPQRAPGWPQGAFAIESAIDELAAKAGVDPIAIRKINDKRASRHRMLDAAAKEVGWERRKADGKWDGKLKRGFGVGAAEWENKFFAPAGAEIRVYPDGKMEIRSGIQDIGNGNRTMLVDLAAHGTGVSRKFITGLCGSTEFPPGPPSGGSVVARSIAPAVLDAANQAKADLLGRAAKELGVEASTLAIKGEEIANADGSKKIGWVALCKLIGTDAISFTGKGDPSLRGEGDSDGVCAAEVEVDTETGVVRLVKVVTVQQCGAAVNRKIVESQIVGGTIQGISYAMFEDRILSVVNGAPVNPNMEWYKIAGPVDMPEIVPIIDQPEGATGVRSLGEPPIIGVPGAIANAVANAIGGRVRSLPITPAKVLAALGEKGGVA